MHRLLCKSVKALSGIINDVLEGAQICASDMRVTRKH